MNKMKFQTKFLQFATRKFGSQSVLADLIESNQVQLSRYATGKRDMPLSVFLKILKAVGGKIQLPNFDMRKSYEFKRGKN